MQLTTKELEQVFYSGGNSFRIDKQIIVDLGYMLSSGLILLKKIKVGNRTEYYNLIDKIQDGLINTYDMEGGSTGHNALKLMAAHYLKSHGYSDLIFETEFEGYRPDVMVRPGKILVECGTVNIDKPFKYFKNKRVRQLFILPYPEEDAPTLYAYIFTPGDDLADFLCFLEEERVRTASSHN